MTKMLKIVKREFLTKVFTKGFLIGTLIGPILIIGISFAPAYFMNVSSEEPMTIRIVDYTGSLAEDIIAAFPDTLNNGQPRFIFSEIEPDNFSENKEAFTNNIEESLVDGIIKIPDDILEAGSISYYAKSVSDIDLIQKIRNEVSNVVNNTRLEKAGLNADLVKKLTKRIEVRTIKIQKGEEKESGFGQEYFSSFTFLLILYMTILFYGNNIMRSVIEEKSSRIIEILLSSTNSFQLMMGKLLGTGSAGLVQYLIWSVMAALAFFITMSTAPAIAQFINLSPSVLIYFIIFFIFGFFTFSTLYAAVGAMCSDMQDAQSLSGPVTLMIVLPFMVSFMAIRNPTSDLTQIISFIPLFTPMIMFTRVTLVTIPFLEIASALMINLIFIIFIIWLTARIYRVGILMYGKRPNLPELIRWIRYS